MENVRRELMEAEIQALLDSLADLREKASIKAVFGEPVTAEGRTVIPVAEVAYGFAMGAGYGPVAEGEEEEAPQRAGGGGGVKAHPLAVVEVTPEGTSVEPVIDEQKVTLAGALLAGWAVFCLAKALIKIFGRQE
jgi:uncharacterized spore protein YtfJ